MATKLRRFCLSRARTVGAVLPLLVTLGAQAQAPAPAGAVPVAPTAGPPESPVSVPQAEAPASVPQPAEARSDEASVSPVGGASGGQVPAANVAPSRTPAVSAPPAPPPTAGAPVAMAVVTPSAESVAAKEEAPKTRFPWAAFLDISPLWQRSKVFDLVSHDDLSWRLGVTLERDLVAVTAKDILAVDLGWSRESQSDTVFGDFQSELDVHNVTLGLRLRRQWHPILATHVSLLGGASRLQTRFGWGSRGVDWLPAGQVGAGLSCQLPRVHQVQTGVLGEGGYFFSGSSDVRVESRVAAQSSFNYANPDLGTLERSGPYLRFSLYLRY